jgi:protein-L-isoaspartate(D-aspartate) O-methyltransferase
MELVEEATAVPDTDEFAAQREQLIQEGIIGMGITDEAVIEALRRVPRHQFVPTNIWPRPTTTTPCPSATARRFRSPSLWP